MGIGMIIAGLAAIILGEVLFRRRGVGFAIAAVILGTVVYRLIITSSLRAGLGPNNLKLVTAGLVILVLAGPGLQLRLPGRRKLVAKGSIGTDELRGASSRFALGAAGTNPSRGDDRP
jgi:putative ABC transport system permease protein